MSVYHIVENEHALQVVPKEYWIYIWKAATEQALLGIHPSNYTFTAGYMAFKYSSYGNQNLTSTMLAKIVYSWTKEIPLLDLTMVIPQLRNLQKATAHGILPYHGRKSANSSRV